MNRMVKPAELQLRDVVKLSDIPFAYAVVRQIADGKIELFRPYATTSDFSHTGGVIPYIGIEQFAIPINDSRTIELVERRFCD
jgi:hypothetical protein